MLRRSQTVESPQLHVMLSPLRFLWGQLRLIGRVGSRKLSLITHCKIRQRCRSAFCSLLLTVVYATYARSSLTRKASDPLYHSLGSVHVQTLPSKVQGIVGFLLEEEDCSRGLKQDSLTRKTSDTLYHSLGGVHVLTLPSEVLGIVGFLLEGGLFLWSDQVKGRF